MSAERAYVDVRPRDAILRCLAYDRNDIDGIDGTARSDELDWLWRERFVDGARERHAAKRSISRAAELDLLEGSSAPPQR